MIIHAHTQAYTVRLSKHIHTLSTSVCRLKPIKPIEIFQSGLGSKIQDPRLLRGISWESWILVPIEISIGSIGFNRDPRFCQQTSGQSWILDLGSHPRLKFQSVQSVSIGIQDSANRPLDNLGSWIFDPIPD